MTLFELCDKLGATLVIKRVSSKSSRKKSEKGKIRYAVNIQCARLYPDRERSRIYDTHQTAMITGEDVNKILYDLCTKVSNKFIRCGHKEFVVGLVEKGNFSILGVW